MNGLVVYYSKYGNCAQIADAIHKGLIESGHDIGIATVKEVSETDDMDLDFVVVGGPTRAGRAAGPIKRFAKDFSASSAGGGARFAAFGTGLAQGIEKGEKISADRLHDMLCEMGLAPVAEPFKASVTGMKGPLAEGELERAVEYGKHLGDCIENPET